MLSKQHCARRAHDKRSTAESLHAYRLDYLHVRWARLFACVVGIQKHHNSRKCTYLPLWGTNEILCLGTYFQKLDYGGYIAVLNIQHEVQYTPLHHMSLPFPSATCSFQRKLTALDLWCHISSTLGTEHTHSYRWQEILAWSLHEIQFTVTLAKIDWLVRPHSHMPLVTCYTVIIYRT